MIDHAEFLGRVCDFDLALQNQLDDLNRQIESLLDRIVETSNASVVGAYEDKIEKLERDKIVLREKIDNAVPERGRFEDCMELALRFLFEVI